MPKLYPICVISMDSTQITIKDALNILLDEKAPACIAWVIEHGDEYIFMQSYSREESLKRARCTIEKWEKATASKTRWDALLPTPPPQLDSNVLTIGELHAHLTKLLALHPEIANVLVEHEECHGWDQAGEVFFDMEENVLRIS